MKVTRIILILAMWIALSAGGAYGQEYQKIEAQLKTAITSRDSINRLLDTNRNTVENNPEKRTELSRVIISLEDELYTINSRITKLNNELASLKPETVESEVKLPSKGIFTVNSTANIEARIESIIRTIPPMYAELEQCKQQYEAATTPAATNELLAQSEQIKARISSADSLIGTIWKPVYDEKINSYLVTIDKISGIDRLEIEKIDNEARIVRRREALAAGSVAPNAVAYPAQKILLAKYELMIARSLDMTPLVESMEKSIALMPKPSTENYPLIIFEPRSFILYSGITLGAKYEGMTVDSIQTLIIPPKGIYYTVQVLIMQTKPTSMASFRGAQPLRVNITSNKMYQYTAGGFKDYKTAAAAIATLQKAGYRNTMVVLAWIDGTPTTTAKARAAEEEIVKNNSVRYSVEVKTRNQALISTLRTLVDDYAEGKQITRAVQEFDSIFSIFPFAGKAEADGLAKIIGAKENTSVEVTNIN